MKPAPFAYHDPTTVDEAVSLLGEDGDVRVLAGGQSLVPLMKFRTAKPSALVDVNGVEGLDAIEVTDAELRLGALVRQQVLVDDERIREGWPLLAEAARHVGFLATRHRGTIGGSLAFAAPWAELTAAAVALDAAIDIASAGGSRTLAARDFFRGPHETALERGELIVAVRFPRVPERTGAGFLEVSARYGDYARVAAAGLVTLDGAGRCASAELVLLRVAPRPYRAEIASIVGGTELDDATLEEVAGSLDGLEPPDDVEASGTYRKRVAKTLATRVLARAREAAA